METKKKFNIYVVGAVGSGKTEFAKQLNACLYGELKLEPVETPLLPLAYEEPEIFGMMLQEHFLYEMFKQSYNALSNIRVFDSAFELNRAFEFSRFSNGQITVEEHKIFINTYLKLKDIAERGVTPIFVFLHIPLSVALDRIAERGREYENEAKIEIFKENMSVMETKLFDSIKLSGAHVIHVDNENCELAKFKKRVSEVAADIREIINL